MKRIAVRIPLQKPADGATADHVEPRIGKAERSPGFQAIKHQRFVGAGYSTS